jgi:streptogramin lyase
MYHRSSRFPVAGAEGETDKLTRLTAGPEPATRRRSRIRRLAVWTALLLGLPVVTVGLTVGTAAASAGKVTIYTGTGISSPSGIAAGPDGTLWFTNQGNNSIGRITTAGSVTNYTDTIIASPNGIATGPDGALWFTNEGGNMGFGSIGRITTTGTVTNYTATGIVFPYEITAGPDGALWFTNLDGNSVGRITTGGAVTIYTDPSIHYPHGITSGPDGALWFTNVDTNTIGRITTSGAVTSYADPSITFLSRITAGPDGALWFTNGAKSIGRITTSGAVTNHTDPGINGPYDIAAGTDGALWFTNVGNNTIGRITTAVTPRISSVTPKSGTVGTTVTIRGQNLSGTATVAFNGTPAMIVTHTATKIVTKVPAGATTGPISVTTPAGTATSLGTFTVT